MRILIIGTTEDDISYIKAKMHIEQVDTIAKDVNVYLGKYNNRNIVLVATGQTEMISSMICGITIEKYQPYFCIHIGNVHSFSENFKQTDLFLATRVYLSSINQMPLGRISYGQIPDMKAFFTPDATLVQKIKDINSTMANKNLVRGVLLSDDIFRTKPEEMSALIDRYFVKIESMVACDSSSGGIVVSCDKYKIPFLIIKVCSYELGNKEQMITRQRKGLSVQPYVGKLIASLIEDN